MYSLVYVTSTKQFKKKNVCYSWIPVYIYIMQAIQNICIVSIIRDYSEVGGIVALVHSLVPSIYSS